MKSKRKKSKKLNLPKITEAKIEDESKTIVIPDDLSHFEK